MNNEFVARELWLRYTSPTGSTHVMEHRVWNAERFVAAQQAAAAKVNADHATKTGKPCTTAKVQQLTHEQFLAERAS